MVVLALDTATRQGSAALWMDGACDVAAGDPARTHGERLPAELLALLKARSLTLRDVDLFAVISGPGSFTGLRVGMAAIQGLALTTGKSVVAVPTLEAMRRSLEPEPRNPGTSEPRNLVAALDGQRGDVFYAAWRGAEQVIEPRVGSAEDLVRDVAAADFDGAATLVGIGLERHEPALRPLGLLVQAIPRSLAAVAAEIAASDPAQAVIPHALRPLYIRRPDAVLARERAGLAR